MPRLRVNIKEMRITQTTSFPLVFEGPRGGRVTPVTGTGGGGKSTMSVNHTDSVSRLRAYSVSA